MKFRSFLPKKEFLKKLVAYYYIDGSDDPNYSNSYLFYPHTYTAINIYKNAECKLNNHSGYFYYKKEAGFLKVMTQQILPHRTTQTGKTDKLTIAFKPLGLNHFIKEKFCAIVKKDVQVFVPHNESHWEKMQNELFSTTSIREKRKILDNFLLQIYTGYEHKILEKSIAMISDVNTNQSIEEIATLVNVSRKTLLRHFKSELRLTPELFRIICRFRFALNQKTGKKPLETFTDIAHAANFFDQPHFIKRFKKLTGFTPSQFFKSGTKIGQEDIFWIFAPETN